MRAATKAQDATRRDTLRMVLAALHNAEVEKRVADLDDPDVVSVLQRQAKMRREAIEAYEKGARADLASQEQRELSVIESYLPSQLDRAAIVERARAVIAEVGATSQRDQGRVMQKLMPQLRGQADGKVVAEVVSELLKGA